MTTDDLKEQEGVEVKEETTTEGEVVTEVKVETGTTVNLGTIEATEKDTESGTTTEIKDEITFTAPANTDAKIVMPKTDGENQTLSVKRDDKKEIEINKTQSIESIIESGTTETPAITKEELKQPDKTVTVPVAAVERIFTGEPTGTKFEGAPLKIESPAPTGVAASDPVELPMTLKIGRAHV